MEKIEKFLNCKIQNIDQIYGGGNTVTYTVYDENNNATPCSGECAATDKNVYDSEGQVVKFVSNIDTWFQRDKKHY